MKQYVVFSSCCL